MMRDYEGRARVQGHQARREARVPAARPDPDHEEVQADEAAGAPAGGKRKKAASSSGQVRAESSSGQLRAGAVQTAPEGTRAVRTPGAPEDTRAGRLPGAPASGPPRDRRRGEARSERRRSTRSSSTRESLSRRRCVARSERRSSRWRRSTRLCPCSSGTSIPMSCYRSGSPRATGRCSWCPSSAWPSATSRRSSRNVGWTAR
jgi:hypothetical protein